MVFCTIEKREIDLPRSNKIVPFSKKIGRKLVKFNFCEKLKKILYLLFWLVVDMLRV